MWTRRATGGMRGEARHPVILLPHLTKRTYVFLQFRTKGARLCRRSIATLPAVRSGAHVGLTPQQRYRQCSVGLTPQPGMITGLSPAFGCLSIESNSIFHFLQQKHIFKSQNEPWLRPGPLLILAKVRQTAVALLYARETEFRTSLVMFMMRSKKKRAKR